MSIPKSESIYRYVDIGEIQLHIYCKSLKILTLLLKAQKFNARKRMLGIAFILEKIMFDTTLISNCKSMTFG